MRQLAIAATLATLTTATAASAVPLTLTYDLIQQGGIYAYEFTLTVDNNDGSFVDGQSFDWIVIGAGFTPDGTNTTSAFGDIGARFFTDVPTGWTAMSSMGGFDGPTLGFGSSVGAPYWSPAVGDSISFSGESDVPVADGDLYWAFLLGNGSPEGRGKSHVAEQNPVEVVPLPAGMSLMLAGLAALGIAAGRRRRD